MTNEIPIRFLVRRIWHDREHVSVEHDDFETTRREMQKCRTTTRSEISIPEWMIASECGIAHLVRRRLLALEVGRKAIA